MKIEDYIKKGRCPKCGGVTDYERYETPKNGKPHKPCECLYHLDL